MSKHGTIPTSDDGQPPAPALGSASSLNFFSRAKARAGTALTTATARVPAMPKHGTIPTSSDGSPPAPGSASPKYDTISTSSDGSPPAPGSASPLDFKFISDARNRSTTALATATARVPSLPKYGTIPTSSDGSPPAPGFASPFDFISRASSAPLDFISRAKDRAVNALPSPRPWRELVDVPGALFARAGGLRDAYLRAQANLSCARGFHDAYLRVRDNLAHFAKKYAAVVLVAVFLSLLWHPVSLVVFLPCMVAWLFLYFLRNEPLALCGCAVGNGAVLATLSALTLLPLLLTGAAANILISLLVGLVLVLLHAVFYRAADSIDEEAGGGSGTPPSTRRP